MTLDKILNTEVEDLTGKEKNSLVDFAIDVCHFTKLTPDQLEWLVYYICVKDENGKWHGLMYGNNYDIRFEYEDIYIIIKNPLFFDTKRVGRVSDDDKPTPFKEKYCIKCSEYLAKRKLDLGKLVVIPKYTGYHKVLNGEEEEIEGLE